jgi:hypothetical protein
VPLKDHDELVAELKDANARLAESLKKCRAIVAECRGKLASGERGRRSAFRWREGPDVPAKDEDRRTSQG